MRKALVAVLWLLLCLTLSAQTQDYVCPMDRDVRSSEPGYCMRCGMKLVLGIPDEAEYPVDLKLKPAAPKAGQRVHMEFAVKAPDTGKPVGRFEVVHERLFHLFIVSSDLSYFAHEHPVEGKDGIFRYDHVFPKAGMYRIVDDFYPTGGTPQFVNQTVFVSGGPAFSTAHLEPDMKKQKGENVEVEISSADPVLVAGEKTLLNFTIGPAKGLEKYLGAWAHMLAASEDLIDMLHEHPYIADGGSEMQFELVFPRPGIYRLWLQFQRNGVVNTVAFNVPVSDLK